MYCVAYRETLRVTPFVGVWIETGICCVASAIAIVTPFVGVWIETLIAVNLFKII